MASASRSMVTLPSGSAVVPRRNATSIGKAGKRSVPARRRSTLDEVLGGPRVHPAALEAGVDERAEADVVIRPGRPGGDLPDSMRDHPLREAVRLDPVVQGERAQRRYQRPVAADDPLEHAVVGEVVHSARRAVALACSEDQGEVAGCPGVQEPPLQGEGELLGKPVPTKPVVATVSPASTNPAAASAG